MLHVCGVCVFFWLFFFACAACMAQIPCWRWTQLIIDQVSILARLPYCLSLLPPHLFSSSCFLFLSSSHLLPIFLFLPTPSPLLALAPLIFGTLPPHSAFDDLSQAHGGEYSKAGYGGSAQSQAKSAGSGPGKGTHTTRAHTIITHTDSGLFLWGETDVLTITDDSTAKSVLEKGVCTCTFVIAFWLH